METLQLPRGRYLGGRARAWDFGGFLVSEAEYRAPVFEGWHSHENEHITFLLTGGTRELRRRCDRVATAGDLVFYCSGEPHRNIATRHPSRNLNIEIDSGYSARCGIRSAGVDAIAARPDEARALVAAIYHECLLGDALAGESARQLLLALLGLADARAVGLDEPRWTRDLRDALNDQWGENLSLAELAAIARMHPVSLCKAFPKRFGCSMGEYVRRVRVGRAVALIRGGNRSLTEVAHACGFYDQSHFTRTFRRMTGFSPSAFRKA